MKEALLGRAEVVGTPSAKGRETENNYLGKEELDYGIRRASVGPK